MNNKKTPKLAVSETFYSIQGEGQTVGIPAVFLRLGGCNLLCEGKGWRCDSIEVWRKSKALEFAQVLSLEYAEHLRCGAHLVITGGEPMMHEKKIIEYLHWFNTTFKFLPTIEIETNGTMSPDFNFITRDLLDLVEYWNVSPKLSSAGVQNTPEMRINPAALGAISTNAKNKIFKFVISSQEDVDEYLRDYEPLIGREHTVFMPAGATQAELEITRPIVVEACKQLHIRYTDRTHIVIWNLKTGV